MELIDTKMKDKYKTKAQLISESAELRRRIAELKADVFENAETHLIEKALKESENKYRSVFETAGTALIIIEEDTTISLINKEAEKLSGYSKEEVEDKMKWSDFVVAEELEKMKEFHSIRRIDPDSAPRNYEFRLTDRYGNIKDIYLTTDLIPGTKKSVASLLEITGRKRSEEAIHQAESKFRNLVEQSLVGFFILQGEYYPYVNEKCAEIFGYTAEEVISSKSVYDLIDSEDHDIAGQDILSLFKREKATNINTYKGVKKDGSSIIFEAQGTLTSYNGKPALIGVVVDITERKKAEDALILNEAKFRQLSQQFNTLLDAIPDAIFLLSADLKTIWANKSASLATGNEISGMVGQNCYKLWHNRTEPCDYCPVLKSFKTGKPENTQISTNNGKIWDTRTFPIKDEKGNTVFVINMSSDITRELALKTETERNRHLASLGELAAGVAHEINNPINSVINYAQLLTIECKDRNEEYDISNKIVKEGNRIADIVRNLLSFASDRPDKKFPSGINKILSDSLSLIETRIRKEGIILLINVHEEMPLIYANPQKIQQVFLNIIHNARYALNQKYPGNHEDKILEITGEEIMFDNVSYVRITFLDHSSGIPANLLDKVMDPFFSTKPVGIGTGLGLSISHGIIKDHNGRLSIDSVENRYTKVKVDLPEVQ